MTNTNPEMISALCTDTPVLQDLNRLFPSIWQGIHSELTQLAQHPDPHKIARTLTLAHADWHQYRHVVAGLKAGTKHKVVEQSARRLMRKLAVEQFCQALTQTTLMAEGALRWYEKLLFKRLILPMANSVKPLGMRFHLIIWRLLKNRGAATYALHQAGCYAILSQEFIRAVALRIGGDHKILEIGAGRGILARYLKQQGLEITAVDDFSWREKIAMGSNVVQMDGTQALAQLGPTAVISCWPPPGNDFEAAIFQCASVRIYLAIVSNHRFASGNWQSYAKARDFSCVKSQPLAKLLLPGEADSTVLIFSRLT